MITLATLEYAFVPNPVSIAQAQTLPLETPVQVFGKIMLIQSIEGGQVFDVENGDTIRAVLFSKDTHPLLRRGKNVILHGTISSYRGIKQIRVTSVHPWTD
jgi:DNA/RNA endonuclease YhcR with UshA esterase domain